MAILVEVTPFSRPLPRSKPRWTPLHTTLVKEYNKARRTMNKHPSDITICLAWMSKLAYCKAIKHAKGQYWSKFLAKTAEVDYGGEEIEEDVPIARV